jgi:hypothetical protein
MGIWAATARDGPIVRKRLRQAHADARSKKSGLAPKKCVCGFSGETRCREYRGQC